MFPCKRLSATVGPESRALAAHLSRNRLLADRHKLVAMLRDFRRGSTYAHLGVRERAVMIEALQRRLIDIRRRRKLLDGS